MVLVAVRQDYSKIDASFFFSFGNSAMPALPPIVSDSEDESRMVLPPVVSSEDEGSRQVVPQAAIPKRRRLSKLQPLALEGQMRAEHKVRLRRVVEATCKCKSPFCRKQFAGQSEDNVHAFEKLLEERLLIHQLDKLQSDQKVFGLISSQPHGSREALMLFDAEVCQRAFCLLLGIGKSRFGRLRRAFLQGDGCPDDGRFVPRANAYLPADSTRPLCVEFLQRLYRSVAEPMPESKGDHGDAHTPGFCQRIKRRGKRPRHFFKQTEKGYHPGAKFLPPGTITEYLEICRSDNPGVKISRKTFTRVS